MDQNFDIFVSGNYPLLPIYLSNKEGWQPVSKNSDYYYEKTPKNSEDYYEKNKNPQDYYYQDYEDYNSIYYDWPTTKSPPRSFGFNRYDFMVFESSNFAPLFGLFINNVSFEGARGVPLEEIYSDLSNKRAAHLILCEKISRPICLIRTSAFIISEKPATYTVFLCHKYRVSHNATT